MSTLTVTNIKATGETASRAVSGVAAMWIDIPQGQASINNSINVSSLTDAGQGDGSVNFFSAFSNTTYCVLTGSEDRASTSPIREHDVTEGQKTSSKYDFETFFVNASSDRTNQDCRTYSAIHGDLA